MSKPEAILYDKLKINQAQGIGKLVWNIHKKTLIECMEEYAKIKETESYNKGFEEGSKRIAV